jgi:hypothetical protein
LTGTSVIEFPYKWFDFRFFSQDENWNGCCTCGLARQAAAVIIRQGKPGLFLDSTWLNSLSTYKSNPSVVGFIVEQACLSAISETGFHHGGLNWGPIPAMIFGRSLGAIDYIPYLKDCEMFLVPDTFNFRDIDALYIRVETIEKKVFIVPIQVTTAKEHKDSEASFYSRWSHWLDRFKGYELITTFGLSGIYGLGVLWRRRRRRQGTVCTYFFLPTGRYPSQ